MTRIQNLEAEVARERAIIKQEQHKTVISVTDAYDERLVTNLKMEVEKAKETADNLEKQYLQAAEERDTAQSELEELKRRNAELEKKLEQALSVRYVSKYLMFEQILTLKLMIAKHCFATKYHFHKLYIMSFRPELETFCRKPIIYKGF